MTKTLLNTLLLIVTCTSLFSQTHARKVSVRASKADSRKGFYLGIVGSPDFAYRTLSGSGDGVSNDARNRVEIPRLGFSAGISALWQLTDRVALEMGLDYSLKGEKTKDLKYASVNPSTSPYDYGQRRTYNVSYLEAPIRCNYYITKKRFSLYAFAGVSCNYYLSHKSIYHGTNSGGTNSTITVNEPMEGFPVGTYYGVKDNYYGNLNLQGLAGLGVDYCWQKLRFKMEPIFKYSITNVNTSVERFYSIGLNCGVYYKLK